MQKRQHKESDSLFVRYPGDDEQFNKRYKEKYSKYRKRSKDDSIALTDDENMNKKGHAYSKHKFIAPNMINIGPGYTYQDERANILNLSDNEFVIDSDAENATRR